MSMFVASREKALLAPVNVDDQCNAISASQTMTIPPSGMHPVSELQLVLHHVARLNPL
jgi:hypothetical protein